MEQDETSKVTPLFKTPPKKRRKLPAPANPPPVETYPIDNELVEMLEFYLAEAKRGTLRGVAMALLFRDDQAAFQASTAIAGSARREPYTTAGVIKELEAHHTAKYLLVGAKV